MQEFSRDFPKSQSGNWKKESRPHERAGDSNIARTRYLGLLGLGMYIHYILAIATERNPARKKDIA